MVPTFDPFTFHWYDGFAPPFVGVAVKLIFAPAQIFKLLALIKILGFAVGLTIIPILFEMPLLFVAQGLVFEMTQVTVSLLFSELEANVLLFVPTFTPFTFH